MRPLPAFLARAVLDAVLLVHHLLQQSLIVSAERRHWDVPHGTKLATVIQVFVLKTEKVPHEAPVWGGCYLKNLSAKRFDRQQLRPTWKLQEEPEPWPQCRPQSCSSWSWSKKSGLSRRSAESHPPRWRSSNKPEQTGERVKPEQTGVRVKPEQTGERVWMLDVPHAGQLCTLPYAGKRFLLSGRCFLRPHGQTDPSPCADPTSECTESWRLRTRSACRRRSLHLHGLDLKNTKMETSRNLIWGTDLFEIKV